MRHLGVAQKTADPRKPPFNSPDPRTLETVVPGCLEQFQFQCQAACGWQVGASSSNVVGRWGPAVPMWLAGGRQQFQMQWGTLCNDPTNCAQKICAASAGKRSPTCPELPAPLLDASPHGSSKSCQIYSSKDCKGLTLQR